MSKKNESRKKEARDLKNNAGSGLNASAAGVFWLPFWLFITVLHVWFYFVYKNYLPGHYEIVNLFAGKYSYFSFTAAFSDFFRVLPSNALNLLFLSLIVILAYGMGLGLLSLFNIVVSAAERFIIAVGLGFGAIAYLMLLLGSLGALYKSVILTLFLIGTAVSAYKTRIWEFRAGALRSEIREILKLGPAWTALVILGALFSLLNIVMAFVPETFYDALVYHLAAPGYYLLEHRILPMRFLTHSNFPLNQSMIYMLALSLNNEILAKMIHSLMSVLTIPLIYFTIKRLCNAKAAIFSAVIFCSMPLFAMNSWTCGNDVGLTFFFTLAYTGYLGWLETGGAGQFALFSVFAGISMGLKYTAVFSVTGLACSLAVRSWRVSGLLQAIKKLALYFGIVLLLVLPWLIKNYIFTHNPFQPIFNAENVRLGGVATWGVVSTMRYLFSVRIAGLLLSPWSLTLSGKQSLTHIGPVFLMLFPCLLFFRKMDRLIKYSLLAFCAGYVFWFNNIHDYRYLLPLFPALSVCLGWAVYFISERFKAFKLVIAVIITANLLAVFVLAIKLGLNDYFAKGVSKYDYLSLPRESSANPPYAAIDWINKNLPQEAKVFFIAESRPFYIKRDFISYSAEFNLQPLMVYLRRAKTPDDFYAMLSTEKFTHLLINYREALRNNPEFRDFDWTKRERDIFDGFWKKHVKLEYFKQGVYVYRVLPDVGAGGTPNILEELENNNWAGDSLLKIFDKNKMWASCLEEYELFAGYGNDLSRQIATIKSLMAGPAAAAGAGK